MRKDFFISYNRHDRKMASWIAYTLEKAGYSAVIHERDFTGNWIWEVDNTMQLCERTIVVLSPQYIEANYTFIELANAFIADPKGEKGKLIIIRVADVQLKGILAQWSYIDFVNKKVKEKKKLLLDRAKRIPHTPSTKPVKSTSTKKSFPLLFSTSIIILIGAMLTIYWRSFNRDSFKIKTDTLTSASKSLSISNKKAARHESLEIKATALLKEKNPGSAAIVAVWDQTTRKRKKTFTIQSKFLDEHAALNLKNKIEQDTDLRFTKDAPDYTILITVSPEEPYPIRMGNDLFRLSEGALYVYINSDCAFSEKLESTQPASKENIELHLRKKVRETVVGSIDSITAKINSLKK